ncbi:MAG TPA: T9SS type A sorting domain-containing protein, partial [Flavobacteriaceae bacterium]|nr:T9SS type A sorting domain-containing protein [Flavobacteriaceae bacterium]
ILNHTFDVPNVANTTIDIELHFTPAANQNIEVTNAITRYLGVIPLASFDARSQSFSYTDGLDSAPGGKYDMQSFLGGVQGNPLLTELINNLQQADFCFIPTISAMAIDNEDDWYASIDTGSHAIPFADWFIPNVNEDHVTPTTLNVDFVLQEIRNGQASVSDTSFDSLFKLKQNPVSNEITFLTNSNHNILDVSVVSLTGQKLVSKQLFNVHNEVKLPINLSNGIYFLKVDANNKSYVKKVIVNN